MSQTTFGATFTSGIQDIPASLPTLGTDQRKSHVGAASDGGHPHATATPLSMFGCLGIVQASVGILLTSASSLTARMVRDAGFTLEGSTASLIARTPRGSPVKFAVETRFKELREQYGLEDAELELEQSFEWNTLLLITTFCLSFLGFTPYIPIVISDRSFSPVTVWIFPWLRIIGSAVCVTAAQFAIQCRIIVILRSTRQLSGKPPISDPEKAPSIPLRSRKKDRDTLYLIISQLFLILGIIATVIGYLGCFTLVQNTNSLNAILWLSLEATLCLLRVLIWGWNPHCDENTKVTVRLSLSDIQPGPTTAPSYHDIQGPVERFTEPDIVIYYTLLHEDTNYILLTTVLNLETRSIFVVETKDSILSFSSMNDPSPAYVASFVPSHSTGIIQVQCSTELFYPKDNIQSTGLENIRKHSSQLIRPICRLIDRKDRLAVRWDFRSSSVERSPYQMLSKAYQDAIMSNFSREISQKAQAVIEILNSVKPPKVPSGLSQDPKQLLIHWIARLVRALCSVGTERQPFSSSLKDSDPTPHSQTSSDARSAPSSSHSLLVPPLSQPLTSTPPSPSVPPAQAHPLSRSV
ncbi:hypothetical protein BDP27DRAFT_1448414 [Rhodocollybia butyracea]|uniref:Uncharacterized protein n=1 Tax=Rhodocollybia butyracea TaxID=206335 RepID=A0A9P5PSH3_9AGAR|nr:hypothetical protein BDP27DRAFT_1448414 [Rhodocollybia butyracea]